MLVTLTFTVCAHAFMSAPSKRAQMLTPALRKTGIKIIDIRTHDEWKRTGIVKNSYTMTFFNSSGHYNAEAFLHKLAKVVQKNENFALIGSNGTRTAIIAAFLRKQGYRNVIDLTGGIEKAIANGVQIARNIR